MAPNPLSSSNLFFDQVSSIHSVLCFQVVRRMWAWAVCVNWVIGWRVKGTSCVCIREWRLFYVSNVSNRICHILSLHTESWWLMLFINLHSLHLDNKSWRLTSICLMLAITVLPSDGTRWCCLTKILPFVCLQVFCFIIQWQVHAICIQ